MNKIEVKDLTVSLGNKDIVKNVSLKIKEYSFTSILGPNGCGKSTMLKTIYRVLKPNEGIVYLNGKDIKKYTGKQAAQQMAVVGQFNNVNFDYSVLEVVMMGRTPYLSFMEKEREEDYEISREAIKMVGLEQYIDRKFQSLSGGEKQRVILARALTQKPEILVLDEPTNHLDIRYQLEVMNILKSLNVSVLTALHDLTLAAKYSDYIFMMKEGRICHEGMSSEVITRENIYDVYEIQTDIFESPLDGKMMIQYH